MSHHCINSVLQDNSEDNFSLRNHMETAAHSYLEKMNSSLLSHSTLSITLHTTALYVQLPTSVSEPVAKIREQDNTRKKQ